MRSDEKPVSAAIAAELTKKALAKVPGGKVYRVETDAGDAAYEAHMTKADGTEVTVKFDKNLNVTAVETGMGKGDPMTGGPHGPGGPGPVPHGPARHGSGYGGAGSGTAGLMRLQRASPTAAPLRPTPGAQRGGCSDRLLCRHGVTFSLTLMNPRSGKASRCRLAA